MEPRRREGPPLPPPPDPARLVELAAATVDELARGVEGLDRALRKLDRAFGAGGPGAGALEEVLGELAREVAGRGPLGEAEREEVARRLAERLRGKL
jgi:hypothetical protein